ncbi:MAG: PBP1A family penicillin-binding protein [Myxococcales bacterium]|nr:PBP1A family penicillin-binding protein [Myxococcales bacterium]
MSRRLRRILLWLIGLGLFGILAGVAGIVGIFWYYGQGVEAIDTAAMRAYRPYQVTRITARDGTVLGELYKERRTLVDLAEVPSHVENAFVAAEDADFYNHEGMDYMGMVRAMISNIEAGEIRQGASTITQQVVKNFLLSPERTFERKIHELILARRLEHALSKQEILSLYLNEIYFGHGRYGIEEAARFYFGKSVREVDLGEAALLASMPKAPSKASPHKDPERAKARQVYVLKQMVRHGFAAPREAQEFIDAPLKVIEPTSDADAGEAQEFVDAAREELVRIYGEERLLRLGATVTTTVDLELQKKARAGLRAGLVELDQRQGYGHKIKPVSEKRQEKALARTKGEPAVGSTHAGVVQPVPEGVKLPGDAVAVKVGESMVMLRVPEGSRYDDPKLTHAEQFPIGGITMVTIAAREGEHGQPEGWLVGEIGSGPEAAVIVAEAASGEVLAMVGGTEYQRGGFNRVTQAKRQPGSSFKPFVYGAALASERYSPATLVEDSPEIYEKWRPTNFEGDVYRGEIRLRVALTHSVNTIAIKLLDAVGIEAVHAFARAAGIQSPLTDNLSLALGVSEVTLFDLSRGYLTLARGGSRLEPTVIRRIEIAGGETYEPPREPTQGLREDVVFVLTSMMESVVQEGTGQRAKALKRPAAGKTGTSAEHRDAWFAGFTPRTVAIAWVGFDRPRPLGRGETGGRAALPIWLTAMQAAEADKPPLAFTPPASVLVRTIDKKSGLLAPEPTFDDEGNVIGPSADEVMEEYFVAGTEPVDRAEPAALADGDAILDLYGEVGSAPEEPAAAPEPAPTRPPEEDGDNQFGLPSVLDDP